MPHDGEEHWHEVTGSTKKAGLGQFKQPAMPYDTFMEEQEIPIYREIGISKVQNLALKPWKRQGGRGAAERAGKAGAAEEQAQSRGRWGPARPARPGRWGKTA